MVGGLLTKAWIPGIRFSFCVTSRATPSASSARSPGGLRRIEMLPWLDWPRPPPTELTNASTFGSCWMTSAACRWCRTMSS